MNTKSSGFAALVQEAKGRVKGVSAERVPELLASEPRALLIDTREQDEFAAGHIRGAVSLGKGIIERDIEAIVPDHDRPLFLYCGGGSRSALATDNLQKMGYTRVYNIEGGWRALKNLMETE
jgi:rhodanese-related sulfurtransferase